MRMQALEIEVQWTYLLVLVRILRLVDRELYDDENIFRGIIVKGWSGFLSRQLAGRMN